jgi:hypothetical protein
MAVRSKALVCGPSIAGTSGSNPAEGIDFRLVCFCVRSTGRGLCDELITRSAESCLVCIIEKPRAMKRLSPSWAVERQKRKDEMGLWLDYGKDCPDFDYRISRSSVPTLGSTQPPVQWVPAVLSLKWGGRSVKPTNHLFPVPSCCITAPSSRPYIVWSHWNKVRMKYVGARGADSGDVRWN